MSDDIYSILQRLDVIEGRTTPAYVKKGLNPQQDSVPQMPALFKPKKISVLGSNTDPEHPAKGYAVGSNESAEPAANKLAETMASIEEDMLSKVKKDLTTYLDKLEQKVKSDPDLMAKAVDGVFDLIAAALKAGDEVRLTGFGVFVVATRAGGKGRNPQTGEEITIKPSKAPRFRAGKPLKDLLNA